MRGLISALAADNRVLSLPIQGPMTAPRRILPGMTYMITRRCLDRRYFLKPTPRLVHWLKYVVGEACRRCGVELHCVVVMFDHVHLVVTDRLGLLPLFMQGVFRQMTRVVQAERPDIDGPVFDNRPPCLTALLTPKAVAKQLAYVVTNPVTANLVHRHDMWSGLISTASQLEDYEEAVPRPEACCATGPRRCAFASRRGSHQRRACQPKREHAGRLRC